MRRSLALVVLLTGTTQAALPLDTTLSLRSTVWSGDRLLDDEHGIATASAWARARLDLGEAGQLVGQGWLRDESIKGQDYARLRELYWRFDHDTLGVRAGRQLIVWGRADGFNPTDRFSPRDFTLLAPEDGDLRGGNDALQLSADTAVGRLIVLAMDGAESNTIPLPTAAGVSYRRTRLPGQVQWAGKWEFSSSGLDGSVSAFRGYDAMPDLVLGSVDPEGVSVDLRNQRLTMLGADASFSAGDTIWRGEIALTDSGGQGADDFTRKKPQVWFVGGGEWSWGSGGTLGLQASLQHVFDFRSPDDLPAQQQPLAWRQAATANQTSRNQAGFTWRLAKRMWNDTLLLETSGIAVWPEESGLIRLKADYALTDAWQLQLGAERYFGDPESFFGQLRPNTLAYVQLRYGL
ncbi:hypothetical protein ACTSKR_00740 [Chitinibacteraceae bacterium HSL-7]